MKQKSKKLLSQLLALTMIMSMLSVSAFAAEDDGQSSGEISTTEAAQAALDAAEDGDTIVLQAGSYGTLYIRNTADDTIECPAATTTSAQAIVTRSLSSVTIKAADGSEVTVAGLKLVSGAGSANTKYAQSELLSYLATNGVTGQQKQGQYKAIIKTSNITIDGIDFTGSLDVQVNSVPESEVKNWHVQNCSFTDAQLKLNGSTLKADAQNLNNISIENCTFKDYIVTNAIGVYIQHGGNITIKDCSFDNITKNGISINAYQYGAVSVTGNTFSNIGDRAIRIGEYEDSTQLTITGNTFDSTACSQTELEFIKATGISGETVNWTNAEVSDNVIVGGTAEWQDGLYVLKLSPVAKIGEITYTTLQNAVSAAVDGDTITLMADIEQTESLSFSKSVTLDGDGHTVRVTNAMNGHQLMVDGVNNTAVSVTLEDITLDSNGDAKGVNVYLASARLENVVIKGSTGAGLTVNGSSVTADQLTVLGCAWGSVNVDPGQNVTAPSSFTLSNAGTLDGGIAEGKTGYEQIWSDGANVVEDESNAVSVSAEGFYLVHMSEKGSCWSTTPAKISVAKLGAEYYASLELVKQSGKTPSGGVYNVDPSSLLGGNETVIANTDTDTAVDFPFAIGEKAIEVEVDTGATQGDCSVTEPTTTENTEAEGEAMTEVYDAIVDENAEPVVDLTAAALNMANDSAIITQKVAEDAAEALKNAKIGVSEDATVTVVVEAYLEVKVVDATEVDETLTSLTVDIKPKYNLVATTADDATDMNNDNSAAISEDLDMTVTAPVEVSIPLPEGFADEGETLSVIHVKEDGTRYTYNAAVKKDNEKFYAVFTNPNGFSQFIIAKTVSSVTVDSVSIGDYTVGETVSIDAGTKSGYTFTEWTTTTDGVTFANASAKNTTFTMPGSNVSVTTNWSYNGGGGGGVSTYAVTIADSEHGKVTANKQTASSGTTVTLTVTPDTGYALETLIVTKSDGTEVELTEKDGKYTFKMPASKVTVTATFMEDSTMLNYFVDVFARDYYYDAVMWAVEAGITNGTSDTTFSPDTTCTRAQMATFLWRAAGCPDPVSNVSPFDDVPSDAYYAKAVQWAVEKGITYGTSATTFSPDAECTRAQMASFLWRNANAPAVGNGTNPFADVPADAYYTTAVQWAYEQEITEGTTDTTFSPNAICTRGQMVTFLYRSFAD